MQRLAERQGQFARAILDPTAIIPDGVIGPDGELSALRFAVYRNNVTVGLIEALKDSYPVVKKIVGDEFFSTMARVFVSAHPPVSPVMLQYGAGFAEFIEGFEPATGLPYLADVARIERAWTETFHSADAEPLSGNDFAKIGHADMPRLQLRLHPALRFSKSNYPALTIWKMNIDDAVTAVDFECGGEEALICRPHYEVNAYPLPKGTVLFLASIAHGQTLEKAAQQAWLQHPDFEITKALTGLIECGAFIGWAIPERDQIFPQGEKRHV